jgi:hypothetical protein
MGVRFACHVCGKHLNIKQELAGKRGKCPKCTTRFRIPQTDTETSTPIDDPVPAAIVEQPETMVPPSTGSVPPNARATPAPVDVINADPSAAWYVRPPSGGQYGPADGHLLHQWIAEGRVAATALIWRDGWAQWRPADEVLAEIADELPRHDVGSPAVPPSPTGGVSRSAVTTPAVQTPAITGQSGVGATRQTRSMHRIFWITLLSISAVILIGVLAFLVTRP